jgi:hypothetical protein
MPAGGPFGAGLPLLCTTKLAQRANRRAAGTELFVLSFDLSRRTGRLVDADDGGAARVALGALNRD